MLLYLPNLNLCLLSTVDISDIRWFGHNPSLQKNISNVVHMIASRIISKCYLNVYVYTHLLVFK